MSELEKDIELEENIKNWEKENDVKLLRGRSATTFMYVYYNSSIKKYVGVLPRSMLKPDYNGFVTKNCDTMLGAAKWVALTLKNHGKYKNETTSNYDIKRKRDEEKEQERQQLYDARRSTFVENSTAYRNNMNATMDTYNRIVQQQHQQQLQQQLQQQQQQQLMDYARLRNEMNKNAWQNWSRQVDKPLTIQEKLQISAEQERARALAEHERGQALTHQQQINDTMQNAWQNWGYYQKERGLPLTDEHMQQILLEGQRNEALMKQSDEYKKQRDRWDNERIVKAREMGRQQLLKSVVTNLANDTMAAREKAEDEEELNEIANDILDKTNNIFDGIELSELGGGSKRKKKSKKIKLYKRKTLKKIKKKRTKKVNKKK